jgi:hypothetical protein
MGPHPTKWDKTGIIIEVRQFDQYVVRVDGSGRVTLRNRKFLRKYIPAITCHPHRSLGTNFAHKQLLSTTQGNQRNTNPTSPKTTSDGSKVLPNPIPPMTTHEGGAIPPDKTLPAPEHFSPPSDGMAGPDVGKLDPVAPTIPASVPPARPLHVSDRVPCALARLLPHNTPGLKETIPSPSSDHNTRRSARQKSIIT